MIVKCRRCSVPFQVSLSSKTTEFFCSAGCAVKFRIPTDAEGNFPINAHLIRTLVLGALYFNQLLFWAVSNMLMREGKQIQSEHLYRIDIALAAAVWLVILEIHRSERVTRRKDVALAVLTGAVIIASVIPGGGGLPLLAASTTAFIVWSIRGIVFHRSRKI